MKMAAGEKIRPARQLSGWFRQLPEPFRQLPARFRHLAEWFAWFAVEMILPLAVNPALPHPCFICVHLWQWGLSLT